VDFDYQTNVGIRLNKYANTMIYTPRTNKFSVVLGAQAERITLLSDADVLEKYGLDVTRDDTAELSELYCQRQREQLSHDPAVGFCIITNECNMDCSFCYACKNGSDKKSVFDIAWIKKLRSILPDNSFKQVCISGGEPLLYPELVKEVASYFNRVTILTNGSLLTDDFVEWVIATKTLLYVNLDFCISNFEGHSNTDKTREIIQTLVDKYPEFNHLLNVSVVYPIDRLAELPEVRASQSKEFEGIVPVVYNLIDTNGATCGKSNVEIPVEDIEKELLEIEAGTLPINASIFRRYLSKMNMLEAYGVNYESCSSSLSISHSGKIFLCHEYASLPDSDANFCTIDDFDSKLFQAELLDKRVSPPCTDNCGARWICGGMCWANLKYNTYVCPLTRLLAPYAMYIRFNYPIPMDSLCL
jgi:radical SAM protein with 4Fe4S-binding SPASM domain